MAVGRRYAGLTETRKSAAAAILMLAAPGFAQRPGGGGPPDLIQRYDFIAGYLNLTGSQRDQVKRAAPVSACRSRSAWSSEESTQGPAQAKVRGEATV